MAESRGREEGAIALAERLADTFAKADPGLLAEELNRAVSELERLGLSAAEATERRAT